MHFSFSFDYIMIYEVMHFSFSFDYTMIYMKWCISLSSVLITLWYIWSDAFFFQFWLHYDIYKVRISLSVLIKDIKERESTIAEKVCALKYMKNINWDASCFTPLSDARQRESNLHGLQSLLCFIFLGESNIWAEKEEWRAREVQICLGNFGAWDSLTAFLYRCIK